MVGALMRHIMDKVEIIRSTDEASLATSRATYHSHGQGNKHKIFSRFDITEAQTLACARDLLMLCNRTQSGGDTYFCIDALLCDKSKDLCIITPLAAEADPISISVDIVKGVDPNDQSSGRPGHPLLRIRSRSVAAIDGLDADNLLSENNVSRNASNDDQPPHLIRDISDSHDSISSRTGHEINRIDLSDVDSETNTPVKHRSLSQPATKSNYYPNGLKSIGMTNKPSETFDMYPNSSPGKASLADEFSSVSIDDSMTRKKYEVDETIDKNMNDKIGTSVYTGMTDSSASGNQYTGSNNINRDRSILDDSSVVSDITADTAWRAKNYLIPSILSNQPNIESRDYDDTEKDNNSNADDEKDLVNDSESVITDPNNIDLIKTSPKKRFSIKTKGAKVLNNIRKSFTPHVRKDSNIDHSLDISNGGNSNIAVDPSTSTKNNINPSPFGFFRKSEANPGQPSENNLFSPLSRAISLSGNQIAQNTISSNPAMTSNGIGLINTSSSNYCIRIEVKVNSRYRVCDSNPQDDLNSTWGEIQGQFQQSFFIKSGCRGRPVLSDRIVSISVNKAHCNHMT